VDSSLQVFWVGWLVWLGLVWFGWLVGRRAGGQAGRGNPQLSVGSEAWWWKGEGLIYLKFTEF
jgi:hypothetical protein